MASARTIVRRRAGFALVAMIATGAMAALVAIASDQRIASLAFGQAGFYKNAPNYVDGAGMAAPRAVAIDTAASPNHVWVADTGNNRVLGWDDAGAYLSGASAEIVIGQPDFGSSAPNQGGSPSAGTLSSPSGVGVDRSGNLYVADSGNNRVTVFSAPLAGFSGAPIVGGAASGVFGQGGNFQSSAGCVAAQVSAATLCLPEGLALDPAGNLFVADAGNNRVTVYYTPFAGEGAGLTQPRNTAADLFFGQAAGTGSQCNQGGDATPSTLCFEVGGAPLGSVGVAVDKVGDLFVADSGNQRALEYTGPFGSKEADATAANLVFTGTGAQSDPGGIAIDRAGNLYVAWNLGNEIGVYESAVALSNTSENLHIGPGEENPSSGSLSEPAGLAIDAGGNLYAADSGNNRVLEFNDGTSSFPLFASRELGQPDFGHGAINRVDGTGLEAPGGIAIGMDGAQTAVYAADTQNNRVLGWIGASAPDSGAADIVIGQSDFISSRPNAGAAEGGTTLSGPHGAATDPSGNLFVADTGNNRVLEFATPTTSCSPYPCVDSSPAIRVFGTCGSFGASACSPGVVSASSLFGPSAVGFDHAGDLFISDSGNSRVLEFKPQFGAAPAAIGVFGQNGSFTANQCDGGGASALTLCAPGAIAVDGTGDLFIADTENNRALEFTAPFSNPPQASIVFGQGGSFTSTRANSGGASAATLDAPAGVALDSFGNLYIGDTGNNRVLEYAAPYTGAPAAIEVFGQSGMSASGANEGSAPDDLNGLGPDSLSAPGALAFDAQDDLYVADSGNNRVLMYLDPAPPPTPSPTPSATTTPTPTISATATATPTGSPTATATTSTTPSATVSATPTLAPTATPTPVAERITIKPPRINFGKVKLGAARTRRVILINKKSKHSVAVIIESVDPAPAPFTVENQCPRVLAPGARCAIGVTFAPTALGLLHAAIAISDNASGAPQTIEVTGSGK
ncbi:MAG: choice-of-anchor D domain-containing protein [Candidatus Binataceae bacterium]